MIQSMRESGKLYRIAKAWMALGTVPIPLMYRSKTPKIRWQEYQTRPPSDDELRTWFTGRLLNMAVITGWHGLTVLDFDTWEVFETWCQLLGVPETYMVRTARGVHAYYLLDEPTRTRSLGKIDIKGKWGYVLVPPSIHPSGARYHTLYKPEHIKRAGCIADIVPEYMISPEPIDLPPVDLGAVHPSDPWASAANPRVFSAAGKVAGVLARHRIEDLFPDKERTSADGRYYVARCPFHDDHNPSFWIDTKEQKGGCYAGCLDKSVDVINVYAQMHGLSNNEALHVLAG
jgi:hypothetical protein